MCDFRLKPRDDIEVEKGPSLEWISNHGFHLFFEVDPVVVIGKFISAGHAAQKLEQYALNFIVISHPDKVVVG